MENIDSAVQADGLQPVHIADLRQVPLGTLPGDPECGDIVMRVLGRQQYAWRVDVASFDSGI
jgi:hypothetical protein